MPKGINQLRLNSATLCEAVQYWLQDKILQANTNFEIKSVEPKTMNQSTEFVFKLDSKEPRFRIG